MAIARWRATAGSDAPTAATVARRIASTGIARVGFIPADRRSRVPAVVESIAASLATISPHGVAVVLAPESAAIAGEEGSAVGLWTFTKRGVVSRFVPTRTPEPGRWLAGLDELLSNSLSERELVLVDFTGLRAIGELEGAAALVGACCVVATNHRSKEQDIDAIASGLEIDRFLGVLLVD